MKAIRIKAHILALGAAILAAAGLCACSDTIEAPEKPGPEAGLPATISVPLDIVESPVVSRADMAEGLDREIRSLWIATFNAETGRRTGIHFFSNLTPLPEHQLQDITINTISGPMYIVGMANYNDRYAVVDGDLIPLAQVLQDADTWQKYTDIAVTFNRSGTVPTNTPLNAPMLGGFYTEDKHTDGSRPAIKAVDIYPGDATLPGAIHMRRFISHVTFNVDYNASNISNFQIVSWQVVNVPTSTWLYEHDSAGSSAENSTDICTVDGRRFVDTQQMTDTEKTASGYSFDFWQLENKRSGLDPVAQGYSADNAYTYRDREFKDAQGLNTGKFRSLVSSADSDGLNNCATYVEIVVSMELKVDENGKPLAALGLSSRFAEGRYTIHLGYCEGDDNLQKATDFRVRRNTKYTYNVKINNVSDIVVEARREGENSPGAEGSVSDITDTYHHVDAHYNQVNVSLTDSQVRAFQYFVRAYRLDGSAVSFSSEDAASLPAPGDPDYKYFSWVEIIKADNALNSSKMARYRPHGSSGTYTLEEFHKAGLEGSLSGGTYTVFINEYVYEDGDHADGNESGSTAWHGYVNRPDRRVWINVSSDESEDRESQYYNSKYAISQASIQTYYRTDGGLATALGSERTNESLGLNLRNSFNPYTSISSNAGRNYNSGRYNTAQYLMNSSGSGLTWRDNVYWSSHLNPDKAQHINTIDNQDIYLAAHDEPLPAILTRSGSESNISGVASYDPDRTSSPQYIEAIAACLNRNRDLNGDGIINRNEIRWVVPTASQYIRLILGRRSLASPLINATVDRLPNKTASNNGLNSSMLFYASDGRMMWLMEGTSQSEWRQWPASCAAPWEVRCVRNLGTNFNEINSSNPTMPAYTLRAGTNIVDLRRYESKSLRTEAYTSSDYPMPVHDILDQTYNRCYKAFEFFDSIIPLNDARLGINYTTISWDGYLASHNPCKALDYTGKTGWRVPNQKELTIIATLGKHGLNNNGSTMLLSCSYSYYDTDGYSPGANPNDLAGSITSALRYPMKVVIATGATTQADMMSSYYVNSAYYGVRCVRDVE